MWQCHTTINIKNIIKELKGTKTEKNRAKLMEKIKVLLEQVDDSIAQENGNEDGPLCFTPSDLRGLQVI